MNLGYPLKPLADAGFLAVAVIVGIIFGVYTFLHILLVQRCPRLAFDFNYWQSQHFARLWKTFGPMAGKNVRLVVATLASVADKVVLDIGQVSSYSIPSGRKALIYLTRRRPGSGQNVEFYKRENISKIYLVEPCHGLHDDLRANLKKAGLDDVSTIIGLFPCLCWL